MVHSCTFCAYADGQRNPELVVHENEHALVFPSYHQKTGNSGHTLVVSRVHIPNLYELPDELAGPLLTCVARTARAVKSAFGADGVSIRQNNDADGGQDVFHIHFHVVPRFTDDEFDRTAYGRVDEPRRIEQAARIREAWTPINLI